MKRLATATVLLTAFSTLAHAGGLPKPVSLVERMKSYDITHYVRGAQAGRSHGAESAPAAEARSNAKETTKTAKKPAPQPARAD